MKIAVVGWGSLIWAPRELAMGGRWRKDGPLLSVECARKSKNGRLTLALHPTSEPQRTYWCLSALANLEAARKNLQTREGAEHLEDMHWATRTEVHDANDSIAGQLRGWLGEHDAVEAVIWTGLPTTFDGDIVAKAVAYLTALDPSGTVIGKAREYVTKAPAQIQTPVRRQMQRHGWTDVEHPDDLFE